MPVPSFTSWLQRRRIKVPEADQVAPLIAQAGPQGMNRGEIGRAVTLDRDVLDELLNGLVQNGVLKVDGQEGLRVYRV